MNDSKITRRGFLTKAAVVAALPFVASALSSCGEDVNSPAVKSETAMSSFDSILNSKETVSVRSLQKSGEKQGPICLSNSMFLKTAMKYGDYLVMRKMLHDGEIYLQIVQARLIVCSSGSSIVEGIPLDSELFVNPSAVLIELAKFNKSEARKRFKKIQLLEGGNA